MTDDRAQVPIRLHKDIYKKVKAKVQKDNISFQKLMEVLIGAYLKNSKEVMILVTKFASAKHSKRRRYELSESEADALLRMIEADHSPLRDMNKILKEIEEDE